MPNIRPVSDLRNYGEVLKEISVDAPVFLTKNGRGKYAIVDMEEYEKGNYCIAGGDFNKDLLGDSGKIFGIDGTNYTWAQPVDSKLFDGTNLKIVAPYNEKNPIPSCRNADGPYNDKQFVLTVDGFIVSDNVTVTNSDVYDLQFKYSDHNPVYMTFKLNK